MIEAAEEAGTRVLPEYRSLWLRMDGSDQANEPLHATSGVWIMEAGTSAALIMIPGR